MKPRYVKDSHALMTELVLPNDTNQLGFLLGGRLMHWIDIVAAISALRHSGRVCVTASVDRIQFHHPIKLGEVVTLRASVNRAFRTSMEVGVHVTSEGLGSSSGRMANEAFLTFVAVDEHAQPIPVPPIVPETEEEKKCYTEALTRREMRLQRTQA